MSFRSICVALLCLIAMSNCLGSVFDCEFVYIKVMKTKGIYKCKAKNFTVTSIEERITEVRGEHKAQKQTQDVEIFVIENQVCHFLPKDLNLHMPNVYHFDVRNSGLKAVTGDNMKMFPNLKQLYIRNNHIEVVPEKLFEHNPSLEFINLSDNRIRFVGKDVFTSLPSLRILIVERNVCVDGFAFEENAMGHLEGAIAKNCSPAWFLTWFVWQ